LTPCSFLVQKRTYEHTNYIHELINTGVSRQIAGIKIKSKTNPALKSKLLISKTDIKTVKKGFQK